MSTEKIKTRENSRIEPWRGVILGEPASKANSRMLTRIKGVSRFIKSPKALAYARNFLLQCPRINPMFGEDVHVELDIFYASRRPDLDESLILDLLQQRIYHNDRQVKSRRVRWGIDAHNPRAEILIRPMAELDYAGSEE